MNNGLSLTFIIDTLDTTSPRSTEDSMFNYFCYDMVEDLTFQIDQDILSKMFREFYPSSVHVQKSLNQRIFYRII